MADLNAVTSPLLGNCCVPENPTFTASINRYTINFSLMGLCCDRDLDWDSCLILLPLVTSGKSHGKNFSRQNLSQQHMSKKSTVKGNEQFYISLPSFLLSINLPSSFPFPLPSPSLLSLLPSFLPPIFFSFPSSLPSSQLLKLPLGGFLIERNFSAAVFPSIYP